MTTTQKVPPSASSYFNSIFRTSSYFKRFSKEGHRKEDSFKQHFSSPELLLKSNHKVSTSFRLKLVRAASISDDTWGNNRVTPTVGLSPARNSVINSKCKSVLKGSMACTNKSVKTSNMPKLIKRAKSRELRDARISRCKYCHVRYYDHSNCYCAHLPVFQSPLRSSHNATNFCYDESDEDFTSQNPIQQEYHKPENGDFMLRVCQKIGNGNSYTSVKATEVGARRAFEKTSSSGSFSGLRDHSKANEENVDGYKVVSGSADLLKTPDKDLGNEFLHLVITLK